MAGDRQVAIDIKAKVSGEEDVKKLAKDVDKLTSKPATLEVDAKVNPAIDRALDKLDQLDQNARAAAVAAEALGQAVGPELAARADMTAVVNELKRLGLTFEEITANAGELGAKLSAVDSDDLGGRLGKAMGTAHGETEKLSDAANKSRNAFANMVGNTAQDLGALGGVAGSLGVGLGQLAEGAADAANSGQSLGSTLGDVAKSAGPIAALGVAMQLLSSAMEAAKASRAFDAANVDQYFDAINDGTAAVKSFNDEIRETGELSYRTQTGGGPLGMFSSTQDLLPILERAQVAVGQFNTMVDTFGTKSNDQWRASLEAAGVSMLDAIEITKAARNESQARADAAAKDARVTDLLGESEADLAEKTRDAADAQRDRTLAMEAGQAAAEVSARTDEEAAGHLDRINELLRDNADALLARADALNTQVGAATTAADAQRAEQDALTRLGETLEDVNASTDDQVDAAIALAKAHDDTTAAVAKAEGRQQTATEKVDGFNSSLLTTAGTLNGPARTAVANYTADVNRVPPEKRTEFIALVEAGKLDEARALLDGTSATRTAAITADANTATAERDLANTANPNGQPRTAQIRAVVINPNYNANLGVIGGAGPRSVNPDAPPGVAATAAPMTVDAASPASSSPSPVFTVAVPVQPRVTVNLNTAVLGSRFEAVRAIRQGVHDGVRLAGRRP